MSITDADPRNYARTSIQPFDSGDAGLRAPSPIDLSARRTQQSVQHSLRPARDPSSNRNDGSPATPSLPGHVQEHEGNSTVPDDHDYTGTPPPHDRASVLLEHGGQPRSAGNDSHYDGHRSELPLLNYTADHSDEQQPLQPGKEQDSNVTEPLASSSNIVARARPCRQRASPSTIGEVLLDLIMALPCVCFLIFAVYVFAYDGKTTTSKTAKTLLRAAGVVSLFDNALVVCGGGY